MAIATLINKHLHRSGPNAGHFAAYLVCSCGHKMQVAFRGWNAMVCPGCKEEVERPKYAGKVRCPCEGDYCTNPTCDWPGRV